MDQQQWPVYLVPRREPVSTRAQKNTRAILRMMARSRRMLHSELPADAFANAPRVWIVAGGPSLRDFDFEQLRGEVVIGANRAFERPHVGMFASQDDRFYKWVNEGALGDDTKAAWIAFPGYKVYVLKEDASTPFPELIHTVYRTSNRHAFPPSITGGFGATNNSGYAALMLAWALGAREIRLLGFDMQGRDGKQEWNHDGYPLVQAENVYQTFVEYFRRAAPALAAAGVTVINHSPDSALDCFPKATLEDAYTALQSKPERPLVCCYATRGTAYEAEAAAMVRSARAFGLETHVELVENRGSWQANTYQKAEIIRDLLIRFNRPILFVDADARFRRYPTLFDNFDAALGLSYFDWDEIPGRKHRTGRELSSAVMYLRPSATVSGLLRQWIALNNERLAAGHHAIEQRNLQEIVEDVRCPYGKYAAELPHTYNQIFDSMAECGAPIIEQMQASRRLKQEVGV